MIDHWLAITLVIAWGSTLAMDATAAGLMMYGVPNMKTDKVDVVERRGHSQKLATDMAWPTGMWP